MKSAVSLTCLVLLFSQAAQAQVMKSDSKVKITAEASKPDDAGNQTVIVTLDIDKGWHIYANPVGNDSFKTIQTTLKFVSKDTDAKITYPPGKKVEDKIAGDYSKYEGKVVIKAQVKRGKDATGPLEFTIKIQACDKDSCLFPATVKKSLP